MIFIWLIYLIQLRKNDFFSALTFKRIKKYKYILFESQDSLL